jgi:hypothetical protein
MPKCYQLIGVPGSGKSTWIKNQEWALAIPVVSTDNFVDAHARKQGKTYTEVFEEYMPMAIELMINQVVAVREAEHDVLWDQTSTTVNSRKKKFRMLPDYDHIAVVFQTPKIEVLKERLIGREASGKVVPWDVVQGMIDNFEMPTEEEGFKEIWYVD